MNKNEPMKSPYADTIEKAPNSKPVTDESVRLPTSMPVRAIEKSHLLQTNLEEYLRKSALYVAYISGACFLLVGLGLTYTATHDISLQAQYAQLVGSTDSIRTQSNITDSSDSEPTFSVVLQPSPQFKLFTDIPDEFSDPLTISFAAQHTESVHVFLRNIETNDRAALPHKLTATDMYAVRVEPQTLASGTYRLLVVLKDKNVGTTHEFTTSQFILVSTATTDKDGGVLVTPEVSQEKLLESNAIPIDAERDELVDDTSGALAEEPPKPPLERFAVLEGRMVTLSDKVTLPIAVPDGVTAVQLYARPVHSLQSQFVVRAVSGADRWFAHFDSRNLPNGSYEFFAVAEINGVTQNSSNIIKQVNNQLIVTNSEPPTTPASEVVSNNTAPNRTQAPNNTLTREFPDTNFVTTDSRDDVVNAADELLTENNDTLRDLLKRYAVAVQSGDQTVIRLAEETLEKKRQELSLRALQNNSTVDIAGRIDERIRERVADSKARVVTFEKLRAKRTLGEAAKDADGDGVSDADERVLYSTNFEVADTDGDGVSDGVEVAGGFDPLTAEQRLQVTYESPRDTFGITREDVLRVENVAPVVAHDTVASTSVTTAVITGRALPHSIVTLYIFSSPVVVTVRTDADGSFTYEFDKELVDGAHDVYVAMTDNTGRIVAQSNPFRFVKEAQAFTPVEAGGTTVTAAPVVEEPQTYNLTIGLSILSFGLILLMLGATLRKQPLVGSNTEESTPSS